MANLVWGKNEKVNALEPATMESHKNSTTIEIRKNSAHSATTQGLAQKPTITHKEEKIALILFLTGGFTIWFMFR